MQVRVLSCSQPNREMPDMDCRLASESEIINALTQIGAFPSQAIGVCVERGNDRVVLHIPSWRPCQNRHFLTIKHHKKMKVGSLVKCVNDDFSAYAPLRLLVLTPTLPNRNEIYTVRGLIEDVGYGEGVLLEEIISLTDTWFNVEQSFLKSRFRELQPPMDLTELLEETITELA